MFEINRQEINWGGRQLILETGALARQSDGAVLVTYGESVVLCTVVASRQPKTGIDFFPLTVHYIEKYYAAGKIPGGFIKRESKPSDKATLTSRLIDRPIRPLFPEGFRNEVQIICTVLSHDMENDPDILALVGASAALAISGVPFLGPLGAARVGYIDGQYVLNPTIEQVEESQLDLIVAGTKDGVMMVESEAQELSEEVMLGAVNFGQEQFQPVIQAIEALVGAGAPEQWAVPEGSAAEAEVFQKLQAAVRADVEKAYQNPVKQERSEALGVLKKKMLEEMVSDDYSETMVVNAFKKLEKEIVRGSLLKTGTRIDGRDTKTVRQIDCRVGVLPRPHGSAVFTRGETQALVVTTLGTAQDEQILDDLDGERRENFLLHYNFPPYSVGETGRIGPPGRREIGHGKLAWRALHPILPSKEEFPYTVRLVSEITESNGSSSMATVCGASLSLMESGVPIKRPVAGIAMGLVKEADDFVVLSDILGDEDHLGDMDFKVAGTDQGITALQMDIKVTGITKEIMEVALEQAKGGRMHILGEMSKALEAPRSAISENAPKIESITIPKDKIGEIIGPGGKMIREICEETGAKIDIEETGKINISAVDGNAIRAAIDRIQGIVAEPELDAIYLGKVEKIMDFGAIVKFLGSKTGLVHISQLSHERVPDVSSVVSEGDEVYVKVIGFDRGKIKLSMKVVDQTSGHQLDSA